jgi:hypothetical protein
VAEQLGLFARREEGPRGEVRIARGARQAEGELLARLGELVAEARREPWRLARPVRVVVPSRSLRGQVAAAVVESAGAPVAGVAIQTLHGLACEVLERAGEPVPRGRPLFALVVARLARAEPALRRGLEGLAEGYGAVAGTVRDLLDAGFEPVHGAAAAELLASDGLQVGSRAQVERALALVRVAARVEAALDELGIGPFPAVLRRAAELLAGAAAVPAGMGAGTVATGAATSFGAAGSEDSTGTSAGAEVATGLAVAATIDALLPARAVLIHGFSDATGLASDLIQALMRHRGACLLLDWPPRPAGAGAVESAFTARLTERLAGFGHGPARARAVPAPRLAGFHAMGAEGEMRELGQRVSALLAGGARAERIGVVARDFGPYRLALRRHFWRLGVAFSALGERGPLTPDGRMARAVLELLRRGDQMAADRFLDLVESLPAGPRIDLRLAFFALGAARLRDLAELAPERFVGGFALPIGVGLRGTSGGGGGDGGAAGMAGEGEADGGVANLAGGDEGEADGGVAGLAGGDEGEADSGVAGLAGGDEGEAAAGEAAEKAPVAEGSVEAPARAVRRRVSGERIAAALRVAARVRARLAAWPEVEEGAARLRAVAALLEGELGWRRDGARGGLVFAALEALALELPPGLALRLDELQQLLADALAETAEVELGGRGAGVQVLTAMEARGRTFDHLFVIGLNRDLFPRVVREDALLPDALRQVLRRVLPDVPVKRGGFDEERYLFAQLLSAAPAVTLSWRAADEDGRPLAPSPLVERLGEALAVVAAPALNAANGAPGGRVRAPAAEGAARPERPPRPADEEAVLAALHGPRARFAEVLAAACREVRRELPQTALEVPPEELAAVRLRILDEMDPDPRSAEGRRTVRRLGPYFGFVGPLAGAAGGDPRRRNLHVTHLEGLAGCPWQLFVARLLRVQPTPDPLGALPGLDNLLLGSLVHAVLDRVVAARVGVREEGPREDEARGPVPVPWPAEAELDRLLHAEAKRLLDEQGMALPGLVRSLAARGRPYLEVARQVDWAPAGGVLPVLESEAQRQITVRDAAAAPRPLRFRADRLDLVQGVPRWTDYKIGRPFSIAKQAETRRRWLVQRVREGVNLQGVAYTRAGGRGTTEMEGARSRLEAIEGARSRLEAMDGAGGRLEATGGAGGPVGEPSVGRYLFLRPDLADDQREYLVTAGDEELDGAFDAASRAVFSAWDEGSFFPRLVDAGGRDEPARCSYCRVAEACLRGDPGARRRLLDWTRRAAGSGVESEADEPGAETGAAASAALLALWRLGQA